MQPKFLNFPPKLALPSVFPNSVNGNAMPLNTQAEHLESSSILLSFSLPNLSENPVAPTFKIYAKTDHSLEFCY